MIEIILPSRPNSAPLPSHNHHLLHKSTFLPTPLTTQIALLQSRKPSGIAPNLTTVTITPRASLIEAPVLWAGRVCVFYVLLKTGLAGSSSSPIISSPASGSENGFGDLGFSNWLTNFQANPDKEASDRRKLVSKWHPTTKGTLRRNYRVPSKSEGKRLLRNIAGLLSEDDHFADAASHKGCQIRRESAHGESVCCNNVRALFDELPTPHLLVEITPFPAGPLTEVDYTKAEKLEKVLRSSPCV